MNYKQYLQKNNIDTTKKDVVFELSNLILEARIFAGISQAELARRIGTQQPSIARAENGELEPSVSFLEKVAKAVDTTLVPPKFGFMLDQDRTGNFRVTLGYLDKKKKSDIFPVSEMYIPYRASTSNKSSFASYKF